MAEATIYIPGVYFTGEPTSSRAVLNERKMIRIFIHERKTDIKRSKYIFRMQIYLRERAEMGQKDLERYAPQSLKLIIVKGYSRNKAIYSRYTRASAMRYVLIRLNFNALIYMQNIFYIFHECIQCMKMRASNGDKMYK